MKHLICQLEQKLVILQQNYIQLASGKSPCIIGKQCEPSPELKMAEGRMQAITDLLRCLKKSVDNSPAPCIHAVIEQWLKLSEISEQWVLYKKAGLTELETCTATDDAD